jgi:hypothetical protein
LRYMSSKNYNANALPRPLQRLACRQLCNFN